MLGGDVEVNVDGIIIVLIYIIVNIEYNNVGDVLDVFDDNVLLWDEIVNGGVGVYNVSYDGKVSIIINVVNGSISEDSIDVVNGF